MTIALKWLQLLLLSVCLVLSACSDDDDDENPGPGADPDPGTGFSDPHGGFHAPMKLGRPASGAMPTMSYNWMLLSNEMGGNGTEGDFDTEAALGSFDLTITADGSGSFDFDLPIYMEQELGFFGTSPTLNFESDTADDEMGSLPANAYADGSFSVFFAGEEGVDFRELDHLLVFEPLSDTGAFLNSFIYHEDDIEMGSFIGADIGINYGFAAKQGPVNVSDLNQDFGFLIYRHAFHADGNMASEATIGRMNDIEGDGDFCLSQEPSFDAFDYDNERVPEIDISHARETGPDCESDDGLTAKITPVGTTGDIKVEITEVEGEDTETFELGLGGFATEGARLIIANEVGIECEDGSEPADLDCATQALDDSYIGFMFAIPISDVAPSLTGESYTLHSFSTFYGDPAGSGPFVQYEACTGTVLSFVDGSTASLTFGSGFACADAEKEDNLDTPHQDSEVGDGTVETLAYSTTAGAITFDLDDGLKANGFISADGKLMILLVSGLIEGEETDATWVIGTLNP